MLNMKVIIFFKHLKKLKKTVFCIMNVDIFFDNIAEIVKVGVFYNTSPNCKLFKTFMIIAFKMFIFYFTSIYFNTNFTMVVSTHLSKISLKSFILNVVFYDGYLCVFLIQHDFINIFQYRVYRKFLNILYIHHHQHDI